jgi:toxin-antitoxin system PIN domain toxin
MIAVDTNILVHAHRAESPWHESAGLALTRLASHAWAIPWPCLHEFLAIVTHPSIFDPPTPLEEALATVESWLSAPTLHLLTEPPGYWQILSDLLEKTRLTGPRVHDARIAALCLQHAVAALWTTDRDFSRFSTLSTLNPLEARTD